VTKDGPEQDVVFRRAWLGDDSQLKRDAREFWLAAQLTPTMIERRINDICAVGYSEGKLAVVSTAIDTHYSFLNSNLLFYRCMVAPEYRQHNLAWRITEYSLSILEKWSLENPQENIRGLMMVIETDKFADGLREPLRSSFGMTLSFVGYSEKSEQRRVIWFKHTRLD
jgi:hypothetical protein